MVSARHSYLRVTITKVTQLWGITEQARTYKQHVRFSETDMKSNSSARQALLLVPLSQINHASTSKQDVWDVMGSIYRKITTRQLNDGYRWKQLKGKISSSSGKTPARILQTLKLNNLPSSDRKGKRVCQRMSAPKRAQNWVNRLRRWKSQRKFYPSESNALCSPKR